MTCPLVWLFGRWLLFTIALAILNEDSLVWPAALLRSSWPYLFLSTRDSRYHVHRYLYLNVFVCWLLLRIKISHIQPMLQQITGLCGQTNQTMSVIKAIFVRTVFQTDAKSQFSYYMIIVAVFFNIRCPGFSISSNFVPHYPQTHWSYSSASSQPTLNLLWNSEDVPWGAHTPLYTF